VRDGLSSTAIAQFLGTYNPSGTSSDDKVSEVALLENLFGPIEAVGINVGTSALDILNQVEGVAPNVVQMRQPISRQPSSWIKSWRI
jgi:hypothetical protein